MNTTFADTILNIAVTGTLVRIDLGTLTPNTTAEGKQEVRATVTQQLVMPLEGFARSFGMQESVIKRMVADGILKAADQTAPAVVSGTKAQ
jgi:hypothetical protein